MAYLVFQTCFSLALICLSWKHAVYFIFNVCSNSPLPGTAGEFMLCPDPVLLTHRETHLSAVLSHFFNSWACVCPNMHNKYAGSMTTEYQEQKWAWCIMWAPARSTGSLFSSSLHFIVLGTGYCHKLHHFSTVNILMQRLRAVKQLSLRYWIYTVPILAVR